jgi:hypothetical protein
MGPLCTRTQRDIVVLGEKLQATRLARLQKVRPTRMTTKSARRKRKRRKRTSSGAGGSANATTPRQWTSKRRRKSSSTCPPADATRSFSPRKTTAPRPAKVRTTRRQLRRRLQRRRQDVGSPPRQCRARPHRSRPGGAGDVRHDHRRERRRIASIPQTRSKRLFSRSFAERTSDPTDSEQPAAVRDRGDPLHGADRGSPIGGSFQFREKVRQRQEIRRLHQVMIESGLGRAATVFDLTPAG